MNFLDGTTNYFTASLAVFLLMAWSPTLPAQSSAMVRIYQEDIVAKNQDRREKHKDANKEIEETNQNKLQPNMQQHNDLAKKHFDEAEEARKQQQEGRAKEEERKGLMELMKAQQLNQQIQENKKTQRQNEKNADTLKDEAPGQPPTFQVARPASESDSKVAQPVSELNSQPVQSASVPSAQLVNLSSFTKLPKVVPSTNQSKFENTSQSQRQVSVPDIEKEIRATFGYEEKQTKKSTPQSSLNEAVPTIGESGTSPRGMMAPTTAISPISKLIASTLPNQKNSDDTFWKTIGNETVERYKFKRCLSKREKKYCSKKKRMTNKRG